MTAAVLASCVAVLALGCTCDRPAAPTPPSTLVGAASADPVAVRMGGRTVRVRCAVGCDAASAELTRLAFDCELDPLSTPHHVGESRALVRLGCCAESESAYRQACGEEGVEACVSRWAAECHHGGGG